MKSSQANIVFSKNHQEPNLSFAYKAVWKSLTPPTSENILLIIIIVKPYPKYVRYADTYFISPFQSIMDKSSDMRHFVGSIFTTSIHIHLLLPKNSCWSCQKSFTPAVNVPDANLLVYPSLVQTITTYLKAYCCN